jgi:hypothetical protein
MTIFWEFFVNLAPFFILYKFKNKIIYNFVIFVAIEKEQIFFHPTLLFLFLDPGCRIRDPGPEGRIIIIRDKHPGSATLGVEGFSQFCIRIYEV